MDSLAFAKAHAAERHADLLLDHAAILAAGLHQFGVSSRLADSSVFNDHDQVRVGDRAESMRNHKARATAHQLRQALLNEPLAVGVQIAGRFVQDQQLRVRQDGSRDDGRC